jgi:flagella basal body P-ring formation protein FlgA
VVRDCAHPERPAELREITWREGRADAVPQQKTAALPPEVRSGMRVEIERDDARVEVHLVGSALSSGRIGDRVAVRVALGGGRLGPVVHGRVRGRAAVELLPEGGER